MGYQEAAGNWEFTPSKDENLRDLGVGGDQWGYAKGRGNVQRRGSREEQRGADRKGYKRGQSCVKRGWSVRLSVPDEPSLSCLCMPSY